MVVLRGDDMAHKRNAVVDRGEMFQIVPNTRKIVVPPLYKTLGSVGDHRSEDVRFYCPQYIDTHDVSGCRAYVTWKTPKGTVGQSDIWLEEVSANTESATDVYFILHWILSADVTDSAGYLEFSLHFEDRDNDGNLLYKWSTGICAECEILKSIAYAGDGGGSNVPEGYVKPSGTLDINGNGEYDVYGYAVANVQVGTTELHPITITENGTYTPPEGYGYSKAVVDVPTPEGNKTITKNGEYHIAQYETVTVKIGDSESDADTDTDTDTEELHIKTVDIIENGTVVVQPDDGYAGMSSVVINTDVQPNLQVKMVTVTENTAMVIKPDEGFDGLSQIVLSTEVDGGTSASSGAILGGTVYHFGGCTSYIVGQQSGGN